MLKNIFSLFLKSPCSLCKRPANEIVCDYCQQRLYSCQLANPAQFWQRELSLFAWGSYSGSLKSAIATLKYENHTELAEIMGYWLAKVWLKSLVSTNIKNLIVLPIPLHKEKLQQRGFNQAELIAQSFCQMTGYSLHKHGLARIRETQPMFGLNGWQRRENIQDAFTLGKDWQNRRPTSPVLLLDDIYTTGTTVNEAAKVLQQNKIKVFGVVTMSMVISPDR